MGTKEAKMQPITARRIAMRYFDWFEQQWKPRRRQRMKLTERWRQQRRRRVLQDLLNEIEAGGIAGLYASLLARTFVADDEDLMDAFGEELAGVAFEDAEIEASKTEAR
jgi:hypothetical protein